MSITVLWGDVDDPWPARRGIHNALVGIIFLASEDATKIRSKVLLNWVALVLKVCIWIYLGIARIGY